MPPGPFPYPKSVENEQLQTLRSEGPLFSGELPQESRFSQEARRHVGQLSPPWTGQSVWYLWGDERRAVRRFIYRYEDEVREQMEKEKNQMLAQKLEDAIWRLMCEEWMWGDYISEETMSAVREREKDE